ncbi:hypothetical protein Adt_45114 [Abeliophyllum distichum]|uniref:Uncharacterized protein n=1 Tax=Abeliophyllum distichum TaxID=126358 RepID=A0ABD1PF67_9LAMI
MVMKLEPNLLEMLTSPAVVTVVGVYKFRSLLKELVIIIAMNNLCSVVLNNKLDNSVICFFGKLKKDEDKVEMLARDLKAMSFMNTQLASENERLRLKVESLTVNEMGFRSMLQALTEEVKRTNS